MPTRTDYTDLYSAVESIVHRPREARLWLAVLLRAAVDAQGRICASDAKALAQTHDPAKYKIVLDETAKDALGWLYDTTAVSVGSYLWICDVLDLCPTTTRTALMEREIPAHWTALIQDQPPQGRPPKAIAQRRIAGAFKR